MKVYVDKNNVDVLDDLFDATNSYECWACNRDDDLEIVSLADYTKQVRKEVCDDFKSRFLATCQIEKGCDTASFSLEVLNRILDQIQD